VREGQLGKRVEGLGIAEEPRHVDEEVLVQRRELFAILPQHPDVGSRLRQAVEGHAADDAAADGGELVLLEIHAADAAQQAEDLRQLIFAERDLFGRPARRGRQVWMRLKMHEPSGDLRWRQHEIDHARANRRERHPVVLRRRGLLSDGDASHRLDFADARGPVGSRARQDDPDGAVPADVGQRSKEEVDGCVLRAVVGARQQVQPALGGEIDVNIRWNHIHVRWLDDGAFGDLDDSQVGFWSEQGRQGALVLGREMLDEHETQRAPARESLQDLREGLQAARRRPDADHRR
jgi:hypothetical protein